MNIHLFSYYLFGHTMSNSSDSDQTVHPYAYHYFISVEFGKPVQTRWETHNDGRYNKIIQPPVTGDTNGMTRQPLRQRFIEHQINEKEPTRELSSTVPHWQSIPGKGGHRNALRRQPLQPL